MRLDSEWIGLRHRISITIVCGRYGDRIRARKRTAMSAHSRAPGLLLCQVGCGRWVVVKEFGSGQCAAGRLNLGGFHRAAIMGRRVLDIQVGIVSALSGVRRWGPVLVHDGLCKRYAGQGPDGRPAAVDSAVVDPIALPCLQEIPVFVVLIVRNRRLVQLPRGVLY